METNALPGADAISVPAGTYTLAIVGRGERAGAQGDLDIKDDLALTGSGSQSGGTIVDGGNIDRVFAVDAGTSVSISNLVVQGGSTGLNNTVGNGAGIVNGGVLTLDSVLVRSNHAVSNPGFPGFGYGGGIENFGGALTITNSTISGNVADSTGGGITQGNDGATTTITNSTITGNQATGAANGFGVGGAIVSGSGSTAVTLVGSTVASNTATAGGGGVAIGSNVTLNVLNSTMSGNRANGGSGGAINAGTGSVTPGQVTITNSTLSANSASNAGGAIASSVAVNLLNSTVVGNAAGTVGGAFTNINNIVTLKNTIVADNAATSGANCQNAVVSQGGNIDTGSTCALSGPGDRSNTDPQLGPLVDNGGPTQTHLPPPASPAIDGGTNSGCPPTDQRGTARPLDGNGDGTAVCDIGAVEVPTTALPVDCSPRPPVGVSAKPTGDGRLRVTLTANGANNTIRRIQVTRNGNGVLDSGSPPVGGTQSQFFVSRQRPGLATTVSLLVTDGCGDWPTFVGGGPNAF